LYQIKHTKDLKNSLNFLEIEGSNKASYAKIQLNLGGSLQELTLLPAKHAVLLRTFLWKRSKIDTSF